MLLVFLAVIMGSFLPDLDMDEGLPFQILFGLLGAALSGLNFYTQYESGDHDLKKLCISALLVFVAVRFIGGFIFERFTNHRGMFHSIPAAILSGLMALWSLDYFSIHLDGKLFIGLAVTVGYLGHLLLDEIYSSINIRNHSLLPKQSLGSALKLYSASHIATFFVYLAIFLIGSSLPEVRHFFGK